MSVQPDRPVRRHADHDPVLICRPALGYGLCEVLEPERESVYEEPEMMPGAWEIREGDEVVSFGVLRSRS